MIKYFLLDNKNKEIAEFFAYSDIAAEYNVTRGVIAGKFNRAREKGSNIITIGKDRIIQKREN